MIFFGNFSCVFPERDARYTKWKMAVQRSLGWVLSKKSESMTSKYRVRQGGYV